MNAILPQYIDSTMMSCFRGCPQKFLTEFCLGLRPIGLSVDLHAGGCFATAIEAIGRECHENGLALPAALEKGFGVFTRAWGDFTALKETTKSFDRVWAAIEAYFAQWPPLTDPIQPYRIGGKATYEYTFAVPLEPTSAIEEMAGAFPRHPESGEPFIYSGRLDRLGTWSGKLVGQDEKTTTSIASTWADQWRLRSQFIGYCWALRQNDLPLDTIAVRGIGILKTKITLVEAMPTYSDWLIERWHSQLRRDLWRLRRMWDEGYFDYNLGEECTKYGGCPFNGLCASPHPENWHAQFTVRRWNPLQKNPIAEAAA